MENSQVEFTPESHRQISKELLKQAEFGVCTSITIALLLVFVYQEVPIELCLLPLILYNLHQIFLAALELSQGSFLSNLRSSYVGYIFIQQLSDCVAKVSLIVHVQLGHFPYITVVSLLIPFVANYCYHQKNYHQIQHVFHMMNTPFYFMVWISIILYVLHSFTSISIGLMVVCLPLIIYLALIAIVSCVLLLFLIILKVFGIVLSELNSEKISIFINSTFLTISLNGIYYTMSLLKYLETESYEELTISTIAILINSFIVYVVLLVFRRSFKEWILVTFEYEVVNSEKTTIELPPRLPTAFKRVSEEFYVPITRRMFKRNSLPKKTLSRPESEKNENDVEDAGAKSLQSEECFYSIIESEQSLCSICFENLCNTVLLPCGHGGICHQCTLTLGKKCHICREKIQRTLEVKQNSKIAYVPS